MQFEDPRTILEAAAAKPSRTIDPRRLVNRGRRLRRARYAAVAAGLAVTIVVASASVGMLARDDGPRPAGTADCDAADTRVTILVREGAPDAEIEDLRQELEAHPDVKSVDYLSAEETADWAREQFTEWGGEGPAVGPSQFRVVAVSEAGAERLARMSDGIIAFAVRGPVDEDLECLADQICEVPPGPPMASFYLKDAAPRTDVEVLQEELRSRDGVEEVSYVSKRRAYAQFRRLYPDQPHLYETIGPKDLPASIRVVARDHDVLSELLYVTAPIIDEVRISGDFYRRVCGGRAPTPAPSLVAEEDSGPAEERPFEPADLVPDVQPDLLTAACGTAPLDIAGGPILDPEQKWCRFGIAVFNAGEVPVPFGYADQRVRTDAGLIRPWMPGLRLLESAGSLFSAPVEPETLARGALWFVLPEDAVPIELTLSTPSPTATNVFALDYDCAENLDEEPNRTCVFGGSLAGSGEFEVSLYHCGVDPVMFAGELWVVKKPPFDATNAPDDFTGTGRFEIVSPRRAVYTDASGRTLEFTADEGWEPPPCD